MKNHPPDFLTARGVPLASLDDCSPSDEVYCKGPSPWYDYRPVHGDNQVEIDGECVLLQDLLAETLFGSSSNYHDSRQEYPEALLTAGLTSESKMSRGDFEKFTKAANDESLWKLLYFCDCAKMVSAIQETMKEVCLFTGEFYSELNFGHLPEDLDGTRWHSGPTTTKLFAFLNMIYVRLSSTLDYTMRIAHEAENLQKSFVKYPKLASHNVLFGRNARLAKIKTKDTLLERSELTREIGLVRDLVTHEGLIDDLPRVYQTVSNGIRTERFILLPDRNGNGWAKHGNRKLFYSGEDRVNLRLPGLVRSYLEKLHATVAEVNNFLRCTYR